MIAIGKKHGTPPFKMNLGFAVYIKNASHRETHLRREIKKAIPQGMAPDNESGNMSPVVVILYKMKCPEQKKPTSPQKQALY